MNKRERDNQWLSKNEPLFQEYQNIIKKTISYKIPNGYLSWDKLCPIITSAVGSYDDLDFMSKYFAEDIDPFMEVAFLPYTLWYVQSAPAYCLSVNLLNAFEQTEVLNKKDLLALLKISLPTFMILFPANYLKTSDGNIIDHAVVHFSDSAKISNSCGEREGVKVRFAGWKEDCEFTVVWSTTDSGNMVSSCAASLTEGVFDHQGGKGDTFRMSNIVLQTLLCLCFKPELITDVEASEIKELGKGFAVKSKSNQPHYLTPRWLGKNYQHQTAKGDRSDREYHVSGWWRKGFWRNQPYGSRVNPSYRPTWIEPTWCQPGE